MTPSDDWLMQAVAGMRPVPPNPEWEKRIRTLCHTELAKRNPRPDGVSRDRMPRLGLVDFAIVAMLGAYLFAMFHEAARLGGVL